MGGLQLIEHLELWHRSGTGIQPGRHSDRSTRGFGLEEGLAHTLGLLFRMLAPMRSRERMRALAEGVGAMEREEAARRLGTAMHRRRPGRVVSALGVLLTEP